MAFYYFTIRNVHLWAIALSVSLFVVRGGLMLARSPLVDAPWLRYPPMAIDTVLLTSALMLTTIIGQYPFVNGWLTAKVLALVTYVVLGTFALRRARTYRGRAAAFAGALACVAYIVSTALHHDWNPLHWA